MIWEILLIGLCSENFTEPAKTECLNTRTKNVDSLGKLRLACKRLYPFKSVKYLGLKTDQMINRDNKSANRNDKLNLEV